jgi:hypothetical protein
MKYQRANLNALPALLILRIRHLKRRMRYPPSSPIKLRVEAFDQNHLIRRKPRLIKPTTQRQSFPPLSDFELTDAQNRV